MCVATSPGRCDKPFTGGWELARQREEEGSRLACARARVGGHAPPKMWTPSQGCRYSLIRTAPPEPVLRPLASPLNASPRPWTSNSHHKAVKAKSSCLSPSKCSLPPHFPTFTGQTFDFRVCVSNHPCQFPGGLLPTGTPASQNPRSSRDGAGIRMETDRVRPGLIS